MSISEPILSEYRVATANEVRAWSFGQLNKVRPPSASPEDNVSSTLYDQRIFGPCRDFECACRKYQGSKFRNMICDRCGVKIAPSAIRASRFGHVELETSMKHPLDDSVDVNCFPVVPARFFESIAGNRLPLEYDRLVDPSVEGDGSQQASIRDIIGLLLPPARVCHDWGLPGFDILTRGMGLIRNDGAIRYDEAYCPACGYLVAGLNSTECPECRTRLPGE